MTTEGEAPAVTVPEDEPRLKKLRIVSKDGTPEGTKLYIVDEDTGEETELNNVIGFEVLPLSIQDSFTQARVTLVNVELDLQVQAEIVNPEEQARSKIFDGARAIWQWFRDHYGKDKDYGKIPVGGVCDGFDELLELQHDKSVLAAQELPPPDQEALDSIEK